MSALCHPRRSCQFPKMSGHGVIADMAIDLKVPTRSCRFSSRSRYLCGMARFAGQLWADCGLLQSIRPLTTRRPLRSDHRNRGSRARYCGADDQRISGPCRSNTHGRCTGESSHRQLSLPLRPRAVSGTCFYRVGHAHKPVRIRYQPARRGYLQHRTLNQASADLQIDIMIGAYGTPFTFILSP